MRTLVMLMAATALPAQTPVNKARQTAVTKLEHVVEGKLHDLNGKYKLRVSETTYLPAGYIGNHHHAGPGIRCLLSGELTYVQPDRTTTYKAGECFFESGEISHTARNLTATPVVLWNFELLPADLVGASAIPVPAGASVAPEPGDGKQ